MRVNLIAVYEFMSENGLSKARQNDVITSGVINVKKVVGWLILSVLDVHCKDCAPRRISEKRQTNKST